MDHRRLDRTNGKDSTLSEKKHFIVPHEPTVYSCNCGYNSWFLESAKEHLEVENALARYKATLKKRIEARKKENEYNYDPDPDNIFPILQAEKYSAIQEDAWVLAEIEKD